MRKNLGILTLTALLLSATTALAGVLATPGGVRFTYQDPNAQSVAVAGSFNNWNGSANPMVLEAGGVWSTVIRLGEGAHEYKFVIDGNWVADPDNPVTIGDFGNSAVFLDASGQLTEAEATSNTPHSAKILLTGRTIGTYISRMNQENGDRFELRRPNFDTDLQFGVRMNDALTAKIVTNVNNESENVEQWRTRLNFDRGIMDYRSGTLRIRAWDNWAVDGWDDPLQLVGGIGIYDYAFGYGTQGAMAEQEWAGFRGQVLFADNFVDGGQTSPANDSFYGLVFASGGAGGFTFWNLEEDGQLRFRDGLSQSYRFNPISGDEDVLAGRVTRDVGDFRLAWNGRLDRGYNPASYGSLQNFRDLTVQFSDSLSGVSDTISVAAQSAERTVYEEGWEEWWGTGLDVAAPDLFAGVDVTAEALYGESHFVGRFGRREDVVLITLPDSAGGDPRGVFANYDGDPLVTTEDLDDFEDFERLDDQKIELDRSWRFWLGLSDLPEVGGVRSAISLEVETHELAPPSTNLDRTLKNEMFVYRADLERSFRVAGRTVDASFGFESFDFRYEQDTPWVNQFWFDTRNFWLENGEHVVAYDRLVMLGDDAVFWRPSLASDVLSSPSIRLEWDGTLAAPGVTRQPEYVENLVRAIWKVRPKWTFLADLRFVKYNDRLLDLNDAYNETFLELKHEVAEGVEIALSYGVDPWVLDDRVNEFRRIGRDLFLFERGANAGVAQVNFFALGDAIREAESALANERNIQIEAIMRF